MTPCPRCHSSMFAEPFADPKGRGQRWTCIACGESTEHYEEANQMTPRQLAELAERTHRGRPRKAQ